VTDRQTDGIAMAYTRYSIYAVARKKSPVFMGVFTGRENDVIRVTQTHTTHSISRIVTTVS